MARVRPQGRGGGPRPAPRGPTLGQVTGGRPGQVRRPPTTQPAAANAPGYSRGGLGLGLNLGARKQGFQQAAQAGQSGQWLAAHPGIQQRIGRVNPTGSQATAIQNFMGTGQSQRIPRPPTQLPMRGGPMLQRQPQQPLGGMRGGPNSDVFGAPGGLPQYGVNLGMQAVLQNRANQGPPPGYQMPGWSGDNASMQGQLGAQAGGYNPPWGSTPDSWRNYAAANPGMIIHQGMGGQPAMGAPPQQGSYYGGGFGSGQTQGSGTGSFAQPWSQQPQWSGGMGGQGGQQYASFGQPPRFQGMAGQPYGSLSGTGGLQGGYGGGQMPNPPSGYGYDATGNLRQGWRPPSAGGIGGNPMMQTATMYAGG